MEQECVGHKIKGVSYRLLCIIYLITLFAGFAYGQKPNKEWKEPIRIGDTYSYFDDLLDAEIDRIQTSSIEFKSERLSDFLGIPSDIFFPQGGFLLANGVGCDIIWQCSSNKFYTEHKNYHHVLFLSIRIKQNSKWMLTDTLIVPPGYDFSEGVASVDGLDVPIICVGIMSDDETFFELTSLYHILSNGTCKRLPLNTNVIDCAVPTNYIHEEEELDESGESLFRFGIKDEKPKKRFSY